MNSIKPFPFRALLAGELRGLSQGAISDLAGSPDGKTADVWIYRMSGEHASTTRIKVIRSEVQLWFENQSLAHAWLRLVFSDGLDYQEVLH